MRSRSHTKISIIHLVTQPPQNHQDGNHNIDPGIKGILHQAIFKRLNPALLKSADAVEHRQPEPVARAVVLAEGGIQTEHTGQLKKQRHGDDGNHQRTPSGQFRFIHRLLDG